MAAGSVGAAASEAQAQSDPLVGPHEPIHVAGSKQANAAAAERAAEAKRVAEGGVPAPYGIPHSSLETNPFDDAPQEGAPAFVQHPAHMDAGREAEHARAEAKRVLDRLHQKH